MRRRRVALLSVTTLVWVLSACAQLASAAGETCSATQKCPKSSPCCGVGGTCGSGALQCAGGCQPMASYAAGSCLPNPVCTDKNLTFAPSDYNNAHMFWPVLLYNGNPSNAPFTLDYGYLGKGSEGVLLELTAPTQTKISTTDYMLYGNVELEARHDPLAGLVFAFITMSDTKDEIDWEFTTSDPNDLQTNYFSQGVVAKGTAASVNKSSISVSDWHTYGLNWQPDQLQWTVDGKVLRTVTRNQAGGNYPRSPSRVQVSVWAGGNSTNPPGVIAWAGGAIDWSSPTYTSQGYYSAEIRSFKTQCASQKASGVNTVGSGNTTTSWVYTGQTSSSLDEPEFVLSTDPITFLSSPDEDGHFGLPGYTDQSAFSKSNKNAWDGSGDTSGLSSKEISGKNSGSGSSSNSGGWLNNNRTLSIAVPAIAGVVVLVVLWALSVWCYRRWQRKNKAYNNELGKGVLARSGVPINSTAFNVGGNRKDGAVVGGGNGGGGVEIGARRSSRYHALNDDDYDDDDDKSMLSHDPTPMGAQRVGQGYGPAVGPRPGPMNRQEWSDSTSSLHDRKGSSFDYHGGAARAPPPPPPQQQQPQRYGESYAMSQRPAVRTAQTPLPPATPGTPGTPGFYAVRGPYTPGLNAYTPAVHQTPAMHTNFASPQQVTYNSPQYTQRYAGGSGGGGGGGSYNGRMQQQQQQQHFGQPQQPQQPYYQPRYGGGAPY